MSHEKKGKTDEGKEKQRKFCAGTRRSVSLGLWTPRRRTCRQSTSGRLSETTETCPAENTGNSSDAKSSANIVKDLKIIYNVTLQTKSVVDKTDCY